MVMDGEVTLKCGSVERDSLGVLDNFPWRNSHKIYNKL